MHFYQNLLLHYDSKYKANIDIIKGIISEIYVVNSNSNIVLVSDNTNDWNEAVNFNELPRYLNPESKNVIIMIDLFILWANQADFIAKMHGFLSDNTISVYWMCSWKKSVMPLKMWEVHEGKFIRMSPINTQRSDMDNYFCSKAFTLPHGRNKVFIYDFKEQKSLILYTDTFQAVGVGIGN